MKNYHVNMATCTRYAQLIVKSSAVNGDGSVKICALKKANIVTLYGHLPSGRIEVIKDFPVTSRVQPRRALQSAEALADRIFMSVPTIKTLQTHTTY